MEEQEKYSCEFTCFFSVLFVLTRNDSNHNASRFPFSLSLLLVSVTSDKNSNIL